MIGEHRLTINVDDIYFLTGISCCGTNISLFGRRLGSETTMSYLDGHCFPRSKLSNGRIDIKTIERLTLRTITFIIAWLCGSVALHVVTKDRMEISLECMKPTFFN